MDERVKTAESDPQACVPLRQVGITHKYTLLRQVGKGNEGLIFEGRDEMDPTREVVIKVSGQRNTLQFNSEFNMYKNMLPLRYRDPNLRVPHVYYCAEEDGFEVLVLERLGPSLQKILKTWQGRFPLKTVFYLAEQMLSVLQFVHSKRVVHRDIKPSNFCLGKRELRNEIYMIDFGLSRKYMFKENHHINYKTNVEFMGNHLYCSINAHKRIEQVRRDDLESLAYLLIHLATGALPWAKAATTPGAKQSDILKMKLQTPTKELCKGLPQCFCVFLSSVRELEYTEDPNYEFYKNLFRISFRLLGYTGGNFELINGD